MNIDKIKLECNYYTIVSCIERSSDGLDDFTMGCVKTIATSNVKVERKFFMAEQPEIEECSEHYILNIKIGNLSHKIIRYCQLTVPKSLII